MANNAPEVFFLQNPAGEVVFEGRISRDEQGVRRSYAIEPAYAKAVFREPAETGLLISCGNENAFVRFLRLLAYARQEDFLRRESPPLKTCLILRQNSAPDIGQQARSFHVFGETKKVMAGVFCRVAQENSFWAEAETIRRIFQQAKFDSPFVYLGDTEQLHELLDIVARMRHYSVTSLFVEEQKLRYVGGGTESVWRKVFDIKRTR